MKVGLVGTPKIKLKTLLNIHEFEDVPLENLQARIGDYRAIFYNPEPYESVPVLKIPKSCLFFNTYEVGSPSLSKFEKIKGKEDQSNFLIRYPSMGGRYIEDALDSTLKGLPFQPLSFEEPGIYYDIAILKKLSTKKRWLNYFQDELKKRILVENENFFRSVTTIVDELILNAFIHGYGVDLDDIHNRQCGKILIRWGLDQFNLVIKVTDFSGNFDTHRFLAKHKINRSADEIVEKKTGGLGLLMAVNFCDHIEVATLKNKQTMVKVYIDLNRVLFSRRGRPKRSTLIIKNTPIIEDFD